MGQPDGSVLPRRPIVYSGHGAECGSLPTPSWAPSKYRRALSEYETDEVWTKTYFSRPLDLESVRATNYVLRPYRQSEQGW